jgi:hypothetical protein
MPQTISQTLIFRREMAKSDRVKVVTNIDRKEKTGKIYDYMSMYSCIISQKDQINLEYHS